ncbi:hypothetical protein [Frankia sp. AiPa1]|uniref:hypothetical protein n=1 Tax=Frankia sp. AiPa1 TaxID=573492 RepID=UPI00202B4362|nr:hypothetical protein [Frankia sp. AiPa1]MCL9762597.1 hypothetical protein [Frankia sp. AiPa1]
MIWQESGRWLARSGRPGLACLDLPTGHLVIFDQRPAERGRVSTELGTQIATSPTSPTGRTIAVIRV